MRNDDAIWKAQVQSCLKTRQRLESFIKGLDATPDWRLTRTIFRSYFSTLEKLVRKVLEKPDRLQVLPDLLQWDVLAFPYWRELEKEKPIKLLIDLWQAWMIGMLSTQRSMEKAILHTSLLKLYLISGTNAFKDTGFKSFATANQLLRRGIYYGEQVIKDHETNVVREFLLTLYSNAGTCMNHQRDIVSANYLFQKGIAHGERFMSDGETDNNVKRMLLELYFNICINMSNRPNRLSQKPSWFYLYLPFLLGWQWNCGFKEHQIDLSIKAKALIKDSYSISKLLEWNKALYYLLLKFNNKKLPHDKISNTIIIASAILLQTDAKDNNELYTNFKISIQLNKQIVEILMASEQQYQKLKDATTRLFPDNQTKLDNLHLYLSNLSLWQRFWHPLAFRHVRQELLAYEALLKHQTISSDKDLWSNVQKCQRNFVDWFAKKWLEFTEIPYELHEPGPVLLGIVFAAHCGEPLKTILANWQIQPPWVEPKDLSAAMTRAGWANVILPAETYSFALYSWVGQIGQPRLTIAEETLNFAGPALIETLRAYNQGNPEPLQRALEYAWMQAQEKASAFAQLLRRLSSAQGTAESFAGSEPPPTEQEVRTALAALVLGDTRAVLAKALHDRLNEQWPLKEDTPLEEAQLCLKRRFSTLVSLSPGPRHHRELAERLHAWCQQALCRELAAPAPDVTEIWNTLEHGRVALLSLKVKAPDPAWEEETARRIHAVLQHTPLVPPPAKPDLIWPPFQCWLARLKEAGLVPELPTIADGQHRLRTDEALVRLFFDPGSGHLFALWLEPDRPLALRRLDSATDWPHWRAFEDKTAPEIHDRWEQWQATAKYGQQGDAAKPGVLDRWERWLEKEEHPRPFPAVFQKVMTSPAVTTVVNTLQDWCQQTDRTRLIILLPAPLAQLPWEVLPPFDSGPITLERAVSLSHWRVSPDPTQLDDLDNPEDPPDPPPLGVFFDSRPDSVILGRWQAQHAGTFWNRAILGTDDGLTAFDILTHLHHHANGHLLLHGEYRQDDPRRSHLQLRSDEHLYAWTASAVGVRGGLFGLAACQANLSGATTQTLLASVGLGPALIASGAAAVIGPLWSCNQWAALAFFHRLFELARQEPKEPWSKLLQRARQDLKQLSKADLLKLFKDNHLAEAEQQFEDYLMNYPELGDPPFGDNPFYWAPFILLGDDQRTDPHMIKPGV